MENEQRECKLQSAERFFEAAICRADTADHDSPAVPLHQRKAHKQEKNGKTWGKVPPRASLSSRVSLLSRYGTWLRLLGSDSALMTLARASSPLVVSHHRDWDGQEGGALGNREDMNSGNEREEGTVRSMGGQRLAC
jgi:hypothetical protein